MKPPSRAELTAQAAEELRSAPRAQASDLVDAAASLGGRPRDVNGVNAGLKMILVAIVICVAISWVGTVAVQYQRMQMVEHLVTTDKDSLRVMCAVDPPGERDFNRLHLCEIVASGGSQVARK